MIELGAKQLATWLDEPSKEVGWYIDGLIPKDSLIIVSGEKKKAMKTYLCMVLGLSVASGAPCGTPPKGSSRIWTPTNAAGVPVLYLLQEGQEDASKRRFRAAATALGIALPQVKMDVSFRKALKLDHSATVQVLRQAVHDSGYGLIILDSLVFLHTQDENDVQGLRKVTDAIMQIREAGCSVMWISHIRKDTKEGSKDIDQRVRGSGVLTDARDTHLGLRCAKRGDPIILEVDHRERDGAQYSLKWDIKNDVQHKPIWAEVLVSPAGETDE